MQALGKRVSKWDILGYLLRVIYEVKVEVDATVVVECKVAYNIGAFNVVRIRIERLEKPRVLPLNKLPTRRIRPQLSLAPSLQL